MKDDRYQNYDESYCYQYKRRIETLQEDKEILRFTDDDLSALRTSDFTFHLLTDKEKDEQYKEIDSFIARYEWLGKMSLHPTHMATARWGGKLAGVVVMDMPTMFNFSLLGAEYRDNERLISRGASAAWTPKNLGSAQLMWTIKEMVQKTDNILFTAYSDPQALELGSIYQACNFFYIGNKYGTKKMYKMPGSDTWTSDRNFRNKSFIKRCAREIGVPWLAPWEKGDSVKWDQMPRTVVEGLRRRYKWWQTQCEVADVAPKHKYLTLMGKNKRETKLLHKLFRERKPKLWENRFNYPKERGH